MNSTIRSNPIKMTEPSLEQTWNELHNNENDEESEKSNNDSFDEITPHKPSMQTRIIETLYIIIKNPAVWYVAGVVDAILIVTFYLHWLK